MAISSRLAMPRAAWKREEPLLIDFSMLKAGLIGSEIICA
jgi:hypothetical protein